MSARELFLRDLMCAQIRTGCKRAAEMEDLVSFDAGGLTFDPWFCKDDCIYRCWNETTLGFYSFIASARGAFRAVNFLIAGHRSLAAELWAPANALFYTSAYHALQAYLGTVGRVVFDSPVWTDSDGRLRPEADNRSLPPSLMVMLRKANTWGLEPRKHGHRWKWLELRQVFGTDDGEIPGFLHALFIELYGGRFRKGADLKAVLQDPDSYRVRIGEVFDEFLALIAHSRHASLYAGIGVDPSLTEAVVNGDHVPYRGQAGGRARAMAAFAEGVLDSSARFLAAQLQRLDLTEELERRLAIRIFDPWADSPRLALLPEGGLRDSMRNIESLYKSLRRG